MDRSQDFQENIDQSETRMIKCVFPETTNHYNTLFGGTALNWMDEVAFITATRFSRKKMVTVSLDKTDFQKPIPAGSFADIHGIVTHVGNKSLKVQVQIFTFMNINFLFHFPPTLLSLSCIILFQPKQQQTSYFIKFSKVNCNFDKQIH